MLESEIWIEANEYLADWIASEIKRQYKDKDELQILALMSVVQDRYLHFFENIVDEGTYDLMQQNNEE